MNRRTINTEVFELDLDRFEDLHQAEDINYLYAVPFGIEDHLRAIDSHWLATSSRICTVDEGHPTSRNKESKCNKCGGLQIWTWYHDVILGERRLLEGKPEDNLHHFPWLTIQYVPHDQAKEWKDHLPPQRFSEEGILCLLGVRINGSLVEPGNLDQARVRLESQLQELTREYPRWKEICSRKAEVYAVRDICQCCED